MDEREEGVQRFAKGVDSAHWTPAHRDVLEFSASLIRSVVEAAGKGDAWQPH